MSKTPDTIFDFPQEIIFNILSRLPAKSLLQFRLVNTSAPPLISHPSFTKLHLTSTANNNHRILIYSRSINDTNHFYSLRSPFTFRKTLNLRLPYKPSCKGGNSQVAGSNKGLICLFDSDDYSSSGTLILSNPSINKYKILDGLHNVSDKFSLFVFGFGFVSRTCEFKLVRIAYNYAYPKPTEDLGLGLGFGLGLGLGFGLGLGLGFGFGFGFGFDFPVVDKNNTVSVYSLSTNTWEKKVGVSAPCYLTRYWSTTYVNGFVNWLAYTKDESRVIMAFDLDSERFQVYGLPKNIDPNHRDLSINSFGEEESLSLSLCVRYHEVNVNKFDVWVMGEYGVADSWKKVFVISHGLLSRPPLLMKNDREILIMIDERLKLFDAVKNEMQDIQTRCNQSFFHAIRYTASLALLDG